MSFELTASETEHFFSVPPAERAEFFGGNPLAFSNAGARKEAIEDFYVSRRLKEHKERMARDMRIFSGVAATLAACALIAFSYGAPHGRSVVARIPEAGANGAVVPERAHPLEASSEARDADFDDSLLLNPSLDSDGAELTVVHVRARTHAKSEPVYTTAGLLQDEDFTGPMSRGVVPFF